MRDFQQIQGADGMSLEVPGGLRIGQKCSPWVLGRGTNPSGRQRLTFGLPLTCGDELAGDTRLCPYRVGVYRLSRSQRGRCHRRRL